MFLCVFMSKQILHHNWIYCNLFKVSNQITQFMGSDQKVNLIISLSSKFSAHVNKASVSVLRLMGCWLVRRWDDAPAVLFEWVHSQKTEYVAMLSSFTLNKDSRSETFILLVRSVCTFVHVCLVFSHTCPLVC